MAPGQHRFLEILVGFGIAATGFGVILAVAGRAASPENRSKTLGIVTAAGSLGQVVGAPDGMLAGLGVTTTSALGAIAISVIGLMNIAGSIAAGPGWAVGFTTSMAAMTWPGGSGSAWGRSVPSCLCRSASGGQ